MAEYLIQDTTLDAIANAINAKTGKMEAMTPAEMVTEIGSISGGGDLGGLVMHTGEITILSQVTDIAINHGFTEMPVVLVVYPKETIPSNPQNNIIGAACAYSGNSIIHSVKNLPAPLATSGQLYGNRIGWYTSANKPNGDIEISTSSYIKSVTNTSFVFGGGGTYPVFNTTYVWEAYAFEGSGS